MRELLIFVSLPDSSATKRKLSLPDQGPHDRQGPCALGSVGIKRVSTARSIDVRYQEETKAFTKKRMQSEAAALLRLAVIPCRWVFAYGSQGFRLGSGV